MKARLVKYAGQDMDQNFPVQVPHCTIGRENGNAVQLQDPKVSKKHAELLYKFGSWSVLDLGSSNGTRINGQPVKKAKLKNGDRLTFGDTTLHFEYVAAGDEWTPSFMIDMSPESVDVTMIDANPRRHRK